MESADVVVVGGGIGGASLACALALEGLGVIVLEASVDDPDRVRGESMHARGIMEVRNRELSPLCSTPGRTSPRLEAVPGRDRRRRDIPVGMMVPSIAGTLNLRHPVA